MQRTYVNIDNWIYRESADFFEVHIHKHLDNMITFNYIKYHWVGFYFYSLLGCLSGYYGYRCKEACSGHCFNNTICDTIDGKCSDGCQPGYIGKLCNDSKIFTSSFYSILDHSHFWTIRFQTHIFFFQFQQLVRTVIMGKTVLVLVPQTAGNVTILTEHVAVMLVGWDLTVVLVFVKLFKYILTFKMNM